jgi:hypothetical protein
MRPRRFAILPIASILLGSLPAMAQIAPTREFTCEKTTITQLDHRLRSGTSGPFVPDSGSAVRFADGISQVSYDELDAIRQSRIGDPVFLCLIRIPRNCPPGDDRGRLYTATNLRTLGSWTMPDSQHDCGGA